jgi:hypothetical protein
MIYCVYCFHRSQVVLLRTFLSKCDIPTVTVMFSWVFRSLPFAALLVVQQTPSQPLALGPGWGCHQASSCHLYLPYFICKYIACLDLVSSGPVVCWQQQTLAVVTLYLNHQLSLSRNFCLCIIVILISKSSFSLFFFLSFRRTDDSCFSLMYSQHF